MAKPRPGAGKGTPRKPIEQKKLEGTYRKDRDGGKDIPIAGAVFSVVAPRLTGAAAKHWEDTVPFLCGLGVIFPQDIPSLYQAFDLLEEVQRLEDIRDEEDAGTVLGKKLKCIGLYNQLMAAFLVSPRERLKAASLFGQEKKKKESAADALLGEK